MTTWTSSTRRRVRALVDDIVDLDRQGWDGARLDILGQRAISLAPRLAERHAPPKPGRTRRQDMDERRRRRAEETAEIRRKVFERAGNACEAQHWTGLKCGLPAVEMHHLRGGSGRRRQEQTVDNCIALCVGHHRDAHRASRRGADGGER